MNIVTKIKKFTLLFEVISLVLISEGFGQSDELNPLQVYAKSGQLMVTCHFEKLLSEDIMDGLSSGLSRNLIFNFTVVGENTEQIQQKKYRVNLKYNVWENIYSAGIARENNVFQTSDDFNKFLDDSLSFSLTALSVLPKDKSLKIVLIVLVEDIAASQKEKLDSWLKQSESTEKSISDQENRSGFSINLSGLLSLFWGKKQDEDQKIYQSEIFTVKSLK